MVHLKQNGKYTLFAKTMFGLAATILGLFASAWGLDNHFMPRTEYELRCELQTQTMQKMQNSITVNDAVNWLRYCAKEERDAYKMWKRFPSNQELRQDYLDAKKEREKAEEDLKKTKAKFGYH